MNERIIKLLNIFTLGLLKETLAYVQWLKAQTAYSRMDYYEHCAFSSTLAGTTKKKRDQELTVSLTSFGARVQSVHVVIESLLQQTVKADKIILWLSREDFDLNTIPALLKKQMRRGLSIRFCEDIKSYKKIIPTLTHHPGDLIITADDDIIYPHDHIEKLYRAYFEEPGVIHCYRAHLMKLDNKSSISPYRNWEYETDYSHASNLVFPTTGAGVIYFPGCFDELVTHQDKFMELCPSADDIWLNLMSTKVGTKAKRIKYSKPLNHYINIPNSKDSSLVRINRKQNDIQLRRTISHYPEILTTLLKKNV